MGEKHVTKNKNDLDKRRRFLKKAAATGALATAGYSLLVSLKRAAAAAVEKLSL